MSNVDAVANNEKRMLDGIVNYAASDKSDPFTFARCMLHHRMGLDKPLKDGSNGGYDASPQSEARETADDTPYFATVYKNVARV
jgi:hypothetical protein